MVTPPALMAATPVGATTMVRLCVLDLRLRRNVVLPVPAFPVRKMFLWVYWTYLYARSSSGVTFYVCVNMAFLVITSEFFGH